MNNSTFSKKDYEKILSNYDLGDFKHARVFTAGTVQINVYIKTSKGEYALRYYRQGRSLDNVRFEINFINYLKKNNFPCPGMFKNRQGKFISLYNKKPVVIFEYIKGIHIADDPSRNQKKQIIKVVSDFHKLSRKYKSDLKKYRWNYSVQLCRKIMRDEVRKLNTSNAKKKLKWLNEESSKIIIPSNLSKGICHCDFDSSNILFENNKFKALIDFDDANYTYLIFDFVSLLDYWAWNHKKYKTINFDEAKNIFSEYNKFRPLSNNEKRHLYDVYKLGILFDSIWFIERGKAEDFYEKRKIDYLNSLGRGEFYNRLF